MSRFTQMLSFKVLLIFLAAGALFYFDQKFDYTLGLDLKGGTQLDYQVDLSKVDPADQDDIVEGVKEVIRKRVDALGVSEPSIQTAIIGTEKHIIVELAGITDIEEAKNAVGKTIQLEFREQNSEPNDEKIALAKSSATQFVNDLKAGGSFQSLAEAAEKTLGMEGVLWESQDLKAVSDFSKSMQDQMVGKKTGDVVGPFEISGEYILGSDGQLHENTGQVVFKVNDRKIEDVTEDVPATVSARHILIAYTGAEKSTATRSKEEAKTLADQLLARIQGGEKLEDLAKEFSDDAGSKEQGGDLGAFDEETMTPNFSKVAFNLGVNELSELVETPFGYHIIQPYAKQEAATKTTPVDKIALDMITFSTAPDKWKKEAALTGDFFQRADVAFDPQTYQPYVTISFTPEGGKKFEELTSKNIGKPIAIFVGGELISAPNVDEAIAGGEASIRSASFTIDTAKELARDLNTGAIPAPIELVGQLTISATLGAEALQSSIHAGFIGFALLCLFMLLYYRLPGLIANIALGIYVIILSFIIKSALPVWVALLITVFTFGVILVMIIKNRDSDAEKFVSFLLSCVIFFFMIHVLSASITLTLAGIAGVILSIGMAVDANVLIFERIKEELGEGKTLVDAIDAGFDRAWDSIRDSNFSSLITCGILFYFGTSIIRGFALNLALGILVSMFSAIALTYSFLQLTAHTPLSKHLALFGKPKQVGHREQKIIEKTWLWFGFSALLSIAAVILVATGGLKLGMDFTGGSLMEISFDSKEITSDQLKAEMPEGTSVVSTDQGSFIMRLKHLSEADHDALISKLSTDLGSLTETRFTTIGPTIGKTLKQKAVIAIILTLVMIVLYIAFAFRKVPKELSPWRFGLSAIAALVHDIFVLVGTFALLGHVAGVEVDVLFVTALLTIMGFSIHDTIVVFDRLRENLKHRKAGETLTETANKALSQTMARSINTSLSVIITISCLLIWGPQSIHFFVLALLVGILIGTYSSIFIATPLLVWWNTRQ